MLPIMETIKRDVPNGKIEGSCDARFLALVDEFEKNFRERGEVGASLCVRIDGQPVVDLWGGLARPAEGVPWERDTVSIVFCARRARLRCARTSWPRAASSTSTRRSPSTGPSSRARARSTRRSR
jgi:hypothetical protein